MGTIAGIYFTRFQEIVLGTYITVVVLSISSLFLPLAVQENIAYSLPYFPTLEAAAQIGVYSVILLLLEYYFNDLFVWLAKTALLLLKNFFAACLLYGVTVIVTLTFYKMQFLTFGDMVWLFTDPEARTYAHWFGYLVTGVYLFFAIIMVIFRDTPVENSLKGGVYHQRGRKLISYKKALKLAEQLMEGESEYLYWGGLNLPLSVATTHFAVIGSTGSGKTILIRLLMQSVLPRIGKGLDSRALVYDAKQDSMSMLKGIAPDTEIILLNPFDRRGVAWDMAKDITSPTIAQQVATILIPEEKNISQPFFSDAARHLLSGVLISLIQNSPGKWNFRDVLLSLSNLERLKNVLLSCPATKDIAEQYLHDGITARNVMSTLATKMQRYQFVAAAWDRATRSISLKEWLTSESILVLGNDEATRTALDAINQVIFKRLSELILAQTESESRRTWIFLDELRQAGKLEGLSSLLTKGRSKGACIVLGYQDIEGLREVYGTQLANEIAGQCSNKAVLRCDSADTARWASALFGQREVLEVRLGVSHASNQGTSRSTNETTAKRDVVLPSEIMGLAPTTQRNGMQGFILTPHVGAYSVHFDGGVLMGRLARRNLAFPDVIPRDEEEQYLREYNAAKDTFGELSNSESDSELLKVGAQKRTIHNTVISEIFKIEREK
jgi:type IV secretory pathway TraG/TraD family ATPase VirD4